MAGEVEEPIRLDYQADSLHSGSISFGRFENEALCWERRSSFRNNRYLEEVTKCSKPGLVTEKKAYFEAHFRKKGIMCMTSSENHDETDYQTNESGISEKTGYHEEINHMNTETYSPCFDESLDESGHEREHGVLDCEKGAFFTSNSEAQIELSCDRVKNAECIAEHRKEEETHNATLGGSLLKHAGSELEMKKNLDGETANLDANNVSDIAIVLFSDSIATTENSNASPKDRQGSISKEIFPSEAECMKPRLEPQVSVAHSRRRVSSTASKSSEKKPTKAVKGVSLRLKPAKKSSEPYAQDKCPTNKTTKSELGRKAKGVEELKRSEKESVNRRIAKPQSSTLPKVSTRVYQSANRVNPVSRTNKPCTKWDNPRSSFNCNEPTEGKKEFVTKLEKKTHAKEDEVPHLQASSWEKTETEIKQLRKSRNFKAKPLPSFYQGALLESNGNKILQALASNLKPGKLRSRSSNIGCRVAENSSSSSASYKNRAAIVIRKPAKTADPPQASGGTSSNSMVTSDSIPSSPAAEISKLHGSKLVLNSQVSGKNELDKDNIIGLHKYKVPDCGNKIYKGKTTNGKPQNFQY